MSGAFSRAINLTSRSWQKTRKKSTVTTPFGGCGGQLQMCLASGGHDQPALAVDVPLEHPGAGDDALGFHAGQDRIEGVGVADGEGRGGPAHGGVSARRSSK